MEEDKKSNNSNSCCSFSGDHLDDRYSGSFEDNLSSEEPMNVEKPKKHNDENKQFSQETDINILSIEYESILDKDFSLKENPIRCKSCHAVVNMFSNLNLIENDKYKWECEFCKKVNEIILNKDSIPITKSIDYIDESIGKDWYLYPKKTAIRYDVKYILNGGENAEENPDSYTVEDGVISLQDPKKDGYSFQGWYTLENGKKSYYKKIGEYRLKSLTLYADWKKIPDNPGMTSLVKLTVGKEKMRVRWKKIRTDVTGYILEYSTSKNFENATSVTIKGWNNNMKIIKGLSSGDKYYVRVRTYSTFDGNTYYSEWAKPKKVKIK